MAQLPAYLRGLMQPEAYPHTVRNIRLIETHISWVLLTGEYAYKLKRPVVYPFVDLRSAERRAFYCDEELRLNRRFAPGLYLGTCDVREEQGRIHIDGAGQALERCVKMRQFAVDQELDRLLASSRIEGAELDAFGRHLAEIHATAPVVQLTDPWGSAEHVRRVVLDNIDEYNAAATRAGSAIPADLRATFEQRLAQLAPVIDARRASGRVRECHGDLHTRNIVRHHGRLTAFDCMEFEPSFRWIDVAEEVALLVADLRAHGHIGPAHAFLEGYLQQSGDFELCRLLDLFAAHRAATRAKVALLQNARGEHDAMLLEVSASLARRQPMLILMAGLSGSGKTWLARRLAPDLGAVLMRSDVERHRLAGLDEHASSGSSLADGMYKPAQTDRVYAHLAECASAVLAGGHSAIVDATFMSRAQRGPFARMARDMGVRLRVVLCEAPAAVLRERIALRRATGTDASEADFAVLDWQLAHAEAIDPSEGLDVVRVTTSPRDPLDYALRTLTS